MMCPDIPFFSIVSSEFRGLCLGEKIWEKQEIPEINTHKFVSEGISILHAKKNLMAESGNPISVDVIYIGTDTHTFRCYVTQQTVTNVEVYECSDLQKSVLTMQKREYGGQGERLFFVGDYENFGESAQKILSFLGIKECAVQEKNKEVHSKFTF